jgi:hypothetical protein
MQRALSGLDMVDMQVEVVTQEQQKRARHKQSWRAQAYGNTYKQTDTRAAQGHIEDDEELDATVDEALVTTLLPLEEARATEEVGTTEETGAMVVMDGTAAGSITAEGDTVVYEQFPWVPVVQGAQASALYAGGSPYVRTGNLTRAMQWGSQLFAESGFAILQPQEASSGAAFNVISLLSSTEDVDAIATTSGEIATAPEFQFIHPAGYSTVTVMQGDGSQLFGNPLRDTWDTPLFNHVLNESAAEQNMIDQRHIMQADLPFAPTGAMSIKPTYVNEEMIAFIASMERAVFAAMPAEKRVEFFIMMIDAWQDEREESTILEILLAAHDASELCMLLTLLRQRGVYEQLFSKLTRGMYELLAYLGETQPEQVLDWHYLADALLAIGIALPDAGSQIAIPELQQAAASFTEQLEQAGNDIQHIVDKESLLSAGPQYLVAFFWMVQQAQAGDTELQSLLTQLVAESCSSIAQAIRGLEYIEQLNAPSSQTDTEMGTSSALRQSLYLASILAALQQFMSIDAMRTALQADLAPLKQLTLLREAIHTQR